MASSAVMVRGGVADVGVDDIGVDNIDYELSLAIAGERLRSV